MKISINDVEFLTLSENQKAVIEFNVLSTQEWVENLLREYIANKFNACFKRLKEEWDTKLAERGIEMIPASPEAYAELVFSQPDYKNRSQRDSETNV